MTKKDDEFLKKLLATFRVEADEHLRAMSSALLDLEKAPADARRAELVETIFREAHSLKGAARAVNLTDIESVCQSLEGVFAALKGGNVTASPQLFDLLQQALDALGGLLSPEAAVGGKPALATLIRALDDAMKGPAPARRKPSPPGPPSAAPAEPAASAGAGLLPATRGGASETVRIATAKLDLVMRQAEELLGPRLAAGERARELRATGAVLATRKKERAEIQAVLRALDRSLQGTGKAIGNGAAGERRNLAKLIEHLEAGNLFVKTLEKIGRAHV